MTPLLRRASQAAWWGFGLTTAALCLAAGLPFLGVPLLAFGLSLVCLAALLLLYNRALAAWRAVLAAWAAYLVLRLLTEACAGAALPFVRVNLAALALILALDAMLTALAALLALAVRRDVSVAYVTLAYAVGAFLMLQMVRSAGGVFNFLTASSAAQPSAGTLLIGPLVLSLSCMVTLGFLSFFPHLLWLVYREARGK